MKLQYLSLIIAIISFFLSSCGLTEEKEFLSPLIITSAITFQATNTVGKEFQNKSDTTTPSPPTFAQMTQRPSLAPSITSLGKTITPDMICSPLKHETINSLQEIISDPYKPPPPGRDERHHGIDFSYYQHGTRDSIEGEGIQAIFPGTVSAVIIDRLPYGNMVIIETPASYLPVLLLTLLDIKLDESVYHLYAHMQEQPIVSLGEEVGCGQAIGEVGMTGLNIVNPHLHLETRIGPANQQFPEMAFYTTSATLEEMENYKTWRTSGKFTHFDPMILFDMIIK